MLDKLKRFLGEGGDRSAAKRETTVQHIRIAACALLLEMAAIDGSFSESEKESILSILRNDYALSDEHATTLMKAADEQLRRSVDLWQFTNLINQNYGKDEKIQIIETVWKVVYADGRLDKHEDYLVHKLANLLRLSHKDLIDAKLKVRGRE